MKKIISLILVVLMFTSVLTAFPVAASDGYTHTDAQYEDSGISLWFDYASEKVSPDSTASTGEESFTVYMAKNEIENAQFLLTADGVREGMTAELDALTDDIGNELSAEILIELYMDCGKYGKVPDPLPPLSAYGAFSLEATKSQAFLIKVKTTPDTVAGDYSAMLRIKDADGKEVKLGKLFVHVWDFALSEKTACATSINLDYGILSRYAATESTAGQELYKNYYEYMLENRISAYYLPELLYKPAAVDYMDNPRVTSFQFGSYTSGTSGLSDAQIKAVYDRYFKVEGGEERFNKSYFFSSVVDAATPAELERLRAFYDDMMSRFGDLTPDYADYPFWLINTYINDIDYMTVDGVIDQIDYYDDFVNFWCSKPFAYTGIEELSTPGAKLMQPVQWNTKYGTFSERMKTIKESGQKVWWFTSWDVNAPYINYFTQTDGVAQRILFWQQYDNGVEGYLTNFVNYWTGDPYVNNVTDQSKPEAYGESILLYPGNKYGLDTPVGSVRMEAMRDGIEDYQLFFMLDELDGEGASDSFIDEMTTGMVTYSVSDEKYYETRKALGARIEKAEEQASCEHDFTVFSETPSTCTTAGEKVYVCTKCEKTYTETLPLADHTYEDGFCKYCGEAEPAPTYILGDLNGDTQVTAMDSNLMKKAVAGTTVLDDTAKKAADLNGDGAITAIDANYLTKFVAGSITEFPK